MRGENFSKREIEVLQLLAKGFSNSDVSEKLQISLRTVQNHVNSMHSKAEAHNIIGVLIFALKHKYIKKFPL